VALVAIVIFALLVPAAADAAPVSARVDRAHDAVRARHGLESLRSDPRLARSARRYARWMVRHQAFTHGDFARRARRLMRRLRLRSVAENLAWAAGQRPPVRRTMRGWMASPSHRANILGRFGRIGVGVVGATPTGGSGRTYVVLFARR
jgi:uncharacterized protein YkwD